MDEVNGLGDFIEFEVLARIFCDSHTILFLQVCLADGQTAEDGTKIADALMAKLEIGESDLLKGAYMDMLPSKQTK